jgi:hypothetical protein
MEAHMKKTVATDGGPIDPNQQAVQARPESSTGKPLLFISHKTDDTKYAQAIAEFVQNISGGLVDVFVSSDPRFEGPRIGKGLNKDLSLALWRAGLVILVYTSEDKDWAWCMWECGVATDPDSPDTKVIVLQCSDAEPKVFQEYLRQGSRLTRYEASQSVF